MILFIRILLLLVFSLFWGGLTFYTGFVVRISHDVLNDPMDGGLITQRVTSVLQMLGVVMVALMLLNAVTVLGHARRLGSLLLVCTGVLAIALVGLFVVHGQLDQVIDVASSEITDRDAFTIGHRRYNQLTTIEWLSSLAYLLLTVFAWRPVDSPVLPQSGNSAT